MDTRGGTSLPHITGENVHVKALANPVQDEDSADTSNGGTLHIDIFPSFLFFVFRVPEDGK